MDVPRIHGEEGKRDGDYDLALLLLLVFIFLVYFDLFGYSLTLKKGFLGHSHGF